MKILAVDPGTTCGWAHSCGVSGVWDLSVRPDESSGMRLVRFRSKLNEIKNSLGIDIVVFEAARNLKYGHAVKIAGEFQGVLELWCIDNKIEYKGYSPTEIKKFATNKGNASKEEVLKAASKRWNVTDHNEADALWLLSLAQRDLSC